MTDPYWAYCFDEAIATWGNYITNELDKIDGKSSKEVERKRYLKLMSLLGAPKEKRYRSFRGKKAPAKT